MTVQPNHPSRFEELTALGQAAFEAGRLEEAISFREQAFLWAEEHGDSRLADLSYCNFIALRNARGERDLLDPNATNRLRSILISNSDLTNTRLAAYNLARAFEYRKDFKKGLFYARIALERAESLGRRDWVGSSHNQIGNFLLAESFFDEACAEYGLALEMLPVEATHSRTMALGNLGYCQAVRGEVREGVRLLYQSLRVFRRLNDETSLAVNHADLCFALLELRRLRLAAQHGEAALKIAEACDAQDQVRNSLYLLGVVAHEAGDRAAESAYFTQLRDRFYSSTPFVTDFLLSVDVRRMINLRAA